MPRILPRLLASIERSPKQKPWEPFVLSRRMPISLHRSVPPRPSFDPSQRSTSILLDSPETNPITNSRVYTRHKRLPPRCRTSKHADLVEDASQDTPRKMTDQELQWWSSPYLRMLASPIRRCIATGRSMPKDFLIRLASMRLPEFLSGKRSDISQIYLPDGLLHPKFIARKSDKAHYILCNRSTIHHVETQNVRRHAVMGLTAHPFLADQIAHLLRLRVLQEFELLAKSMEASLKKKRRTWTSRVIRRLSVQELDAIYTTNNIPHPDAIAIVVVPPLPRDPITGERPGPNMSDAPPKREDIYTSSLAPTPICTLYRVSPQRWDNKLGKDLLPEAQVPFYDGESMFPVQGQRAALHAILQRLLKIERRFLHVDDPVKGERRERKRSSHAYILTSDTESMTRGDAVATAIALWRVRMFDISEEDVVSQRALGWEWTH